MFDLAPKESDLVPKEDGERQVWRITLPNGRPMVVAIDHTNAAGLQGKLTDAMISLNKERGEKKK